MGTSDTPSLPEPLLPFRRRSPTLVLPAAPSEEELAQCWTLSPRDKEAVAKCRGEAQRRRFAVQLWTLRTSGRFLPQAVAAPVAITHSLARQLDLPLLLFGEVPERLATETDPRQRRRLYWGGQPFDAAARGRFTRWLSQRATDAGLPGAWLARAEDLLRHWRIVLPAPSTLEELVASSTVRVQDDLSPRAVTRLPPTLQQAIDALLRVPSGERTSGLLQRKAYPPEASPAGILRSIERYHFLHALGVETMDLSRIRPPLIRYCADRTQRYAVRALRRFPPAKRSTLTVCFLGEVHKTILEHIIALHAQLLTKKRREANNAFEKHYRQVRRQSRRGVRQLIATGEPLLDPRRAPEPTLAARLHELAATELRAAVALCTERHRLEERGEIDALRARYPGRRRYLPAFFALPLQGAPGTDQSLAGLALVRQRDAGTLKTLPRLAPTAFVPRRFWPAWSGPDGPLDRRTWALGRAGAVRDGWRAGDVYLPASRRHVSLAHLGYEPTRGQYEREDAYTELQLPPEPNDVVPQLQGAFDVVAQRAAQGLPRNAFVTIRRARLPLKRRAALELSPRLKQLRRTMDGAWPRVRIEALLTQGDAWCDCPRAFRQAGERAPRVPHCPLTLLATLLAHGTNLGLAMMAPSVEDGLTADMLQEMSQWCLREDTRKTANAILVNFHHRWPLSAGWGDGTVASSDGQRFGLQARALLGSLSPRYCGYYDPALTVSTHVADPHRVLQTQVIACSLREAIDVLDGLLANDTILRPKEHCVDQHGYTEQLFGLCHLLGDSLMPRLTVSQHTLYKLDRTKSYGPLDAVLRGTGEVALLREQWAQRVRGAASLRTRTAPAHVGLTRLARSAPADRLAKALSALGQALKTLYLLRSIQDEPLRARMPLQVNRGEGRHQRAPALFCQSRGVSDRGLCRDHEHGNRSQSFSKCGPRVEYCAQDAPHPATACQRRDHDGG